MIKNRVKTKPNSLTSQSFSIDFVFNRNSVANTVITLIHQFNLIKGTNKEPRGLLDSQPEQMYQIVLALHGEIDVLLNHEDKCSRTFSPCYIIGDIHGKDLFFCIMDNYISPNICRQSGGSTIVGKSNLATTSLPFCKLPVSWGLCWQRSMGLWMRALYYGF